MRFEHRQASHCESGVVSSMLTHAGLPVSEAMVFGLSSALGFAYIPIIRINGLPLVAYRIEPGAIIRGVQKPLNCNIKFETFRHAEEGEQRLNELLQAGTLVGLQTSVYWLPYFPQDLRFHFNAHNLLVYGRVANDYCISDPVAEAVVTCSAKDLEKARFAKGVLAPRGRLYYMTSSPRPPANWRQTLGLSLKRTVKMMKTPFPFIGTWGMHTLARRIAKLPKETEASYQYIGHIIRMQEEIGTGGGGFRYMFAAFLQEASELAKKPEWQQLANEAINIGDGWREFAIDVAAMIRRRRPFEPHALAAQLHEMGQREKKFFNGLAASL